MKLATRNQATFLRTDLARALAQEAFSDSLERRIDQLPLEFRPKNSSRTRCCIYKDRAILRYRLMALLGHAVENEQDETRSLASYAKETLEYDSPPEASLTILDIACSACEGGKHAVTSLCRGCLARPCSANCPKDAIHFINGKAHIQPELCINCGKCRNVCPYSAIVHQQVPCEASCPVDAIAKNEEGIAQIHEEKCIHCGRCSRACPFAAVMERSSLIPVIERLKKNSAIAMIAPSIAGQFPGGLGRIITALKYLGFSAVMEVAAGAEKTAKHEAQEYLEGEQDRPLGTSCCPAYVQAVKKHIKDFLPLVSTTPTPLAYTGAEASKRYPNIPRVFIGPCMAKRDEAREQKSAEFVLTFEELGALFLARDIEIETLDESEPDWSAETGKSWEFAVSGGVAANVASCLSQQGREAPPTRFIDGLDRKGINLLRTGASGKLGNGLWEVMACEGGCLCGPGTVGNPKIARKALDEVIQNHSPSNDRV
ncbi:MAG: monomeric [FeFe] hydrogenase [Spirochaetales bacterium]|nr:monomeric [FeFe] hydrogenase [Spirochaetales bacterium]